MSDDDDDDELLCQATVYPTVEMFIGKFSRFDTTPACDGQTDRQTDVL